jgi:hypothetical protein
MALLEQINNMGNPEGYNLTGQVLSLFSRGHRFEYHKPQNHRRLTWSLTSGPMKLVEVRASWPGHSR